MKSLGKGTALMSLHRSLDLVRGTGQVRGELHQLARRIDPIHVFNADTQLLFGNVDAGFKSDHHPGFERLVVVRGIVDIQANAMAQSVDKVLGQGLPVLIFAVAVPVFVGDAEE